MSLLIIVLAIVVYILKVLKGIFIPLSFAVFLQFMFVPIYRKLGDRKVPVWIINVLVLVIVLGLFFGLGSIVFASVNSFVKEFPKYEVKIQELTQQAIMIFEIPVEEVRSFIANRVNWVQIFDRLSLSKVIASSMGTFFDFIMKRCVCFILDHRIINLKRRFKVHRSKASASSVFLIWFTTYAEVSDYNLY